MNQSLSAVVVALVFLTSAACGHFQRMNLPEHMTRVERKTGGESTIPNATPVSDSAPTEERLPPTKRLLLPPV